MKKALLAGCLLFVYVFSATAQSRVERCSLYSRLLGQEKSFTVYLPDGYDAAESSFPVLYLLHGAFGCDGDWVEKGGLRETADSLIRLGRIAAMVVVMPDARGAGPDRAGERMGYFDQREWPYERYFFEELLPHTERLYRLLPDRENRAVAGLSMGGGGAMAYAQRHPEVFGAAASLSGLLDSYPGRGPSQAMPAEFLRSVAETSPVAYLRGADAQSRRRLRTLRWYADCGDKDFLYRSNTDFYLLMRQSEIPLEYRVRAGAHTWEYWRTGLAGVLEFLFAPRVAERKKAGGAISRR